MEKKKNQAVSPTLEELRQELHQTNQALRNAYDKFNFVTAPELVEASIYEINALKARSDYLLRCIKEQEPAARSGGSRHEGRHRVSVLEKLALGVGGLFMLLGVLRLARSPLKLVFRVAGNAALGFGALWLLGRLAPGLQLGLNLFNGLLIGVLGLPGFGLLLLLQWVL